MLRTLLDAARPSWERAVAFLRDAFDRRDPVALFAIAFTGFIVFALIANVVGL